MARIVSRKAVLYTEMLVANALIHQRHNRAKLDDWLLLPEKGTVYGEGPGRYVLQLGGNCPEQLAEAACIGAEYGYDELNLNCGCPSPTVAGKGAFGAALMLDPKRVARICSSMRDTVGSAIPITVKCRIGVDDHDSYSFLHQFVSTIADTDVVHHFTIHARKAYLSGLSPAQNRTVPPLHYDVLLQLQSDFPELTFSLNGEIASAEDGIQLIKEYACAGVMLGRAVLERPWSTLHPVDQLYYGCPANTLTLSSFFDQYLAYAEAKASQGISKHILLSPILNILRGIPGSKSFKRVMSTTNWKSTPLRAGVTGALTASIDAEMLASSGPCGDSTATR